MIWPLPDGLLDLDAGEIRRGPEPVPLTPLEIRFLRHLAAREGRSVPVEELLVEVWGYHPKAKTRAVYFGVRKLRERLERVPGEPVVLVGTETRGFALRQPPTGPPDLASARDRAARLAPALPSADLDRLVAATGGVPLALDLAASRARVIGVDAALTLLGTDPSALGGELAATTAHALEALDPEMGEALTRLSAVAAPLPIALATAATSPTILAELADRGFLRLDVGVVEAWPWVGALVRGAGPLDGALRDLAVLWLDRGFPPVDPAVTALARALVPVDRSLAVSMAVEMLKLARRHGLTSDHHSVAATLADDPRIAWWSLVVIDRSTLDPAEHRARMEVAFRAVAAVVRGDDLADAAKLLAFVRREQGDFDGAAAALELGRAHTSQPAPVDVELAHLRRSRGDLEGAARAAAEALRGASGPSTTCAALGVLSLVRVDQGLVDEAVSLAERSLAVLEGGPVGPAGAAARMRLLGALRAAGRLADAHREAKALRDQAGGLGEPRFLTLVGLLEALTLLDEERPSEARDRCLSVLAAAPPESDLVPHLRLLQELAGLRATGTSDGVRLEILEEPGLPVPDRLERDAWLAEVTARRGRRAEARDQLEALRTEADRVGYGPRSPIRRALDRAEAAARG